jgi:hypothetical protein
VRPKTQNMTSASTHIFLLAVPAFMRALLVTVIIRSSTLRVSLRMVLIIMSLLRKQGMEIAMAVRIRIFIEKYSIVPLKYDWSSCPGKETRQTRRRKDTKMKLPE